MSIFGSIAAAIFGTPAHAEGTPPANPAQNTVPSSVPGSVPGSVPVVTAANDAHPPMAKSGVATAPVDVMAILEKMDDETDEDLDWSTSIVDLMKLLKLDSSLSARKDLAKELGYTGDTKDSAKMNVWLHKAVMTKLAENGGIVPKKLRD